MTHQLQKRIETLKKILSPIKSSLRKFNEVNQNVFAKPSVFISSLIIVLLTAFIVSTAAYAVKNTTLSPSGDLILSPSGNVGVGKTPAAYKLDVNGIVNATDIYKNGAAFAGGSNVPANTVAAFNQASCPAGWILADGTSGTPDLRGIFIRGAGTNGTRTMANGSAYAATYGTYQNDMMQGHNHTDSGHTHGIDSYWTGSISMPKRIAETEYQTFLGTVLSNTGYANLGDPTATTYGTPRTGAETAPASYALVYCMKTSEDSETSNTIWGTSGSNVFVADISKNVGIGTVSPTERLVIANGNIDFGLHYEKVTGTVNSSRYLKGSCSTGTVVSGTCNNTTNSIPLLNQYPCLTNGTVYMMCDYLGLGPTSTVAVHLLCGNVKTVTTNMEACIY